MLKKPVFLAACAVLAITALSTAEAQQIEVTPVPAASAWRVGNPYVPARKLTKKTKLAATAVANQTEATSTASNSPEAKPAAPPSSVSSNPVFVANADTPAPAPPAPSAPAVVHQPAIAYQPAAHYTPVMMQAPAAPMQAACSS